MTPRTQNRTNANASTTQNRANANANATQVPDNQDRVRNMNWIMHTRENEAYSTYVRPLDHPVQYIARHGMEEPD